MYIIYICVICHVSVTSPYSAYVRVCARGCVCVFTNTIPYITFILLRKPTNKRLRHVSIVKEKAPARVVCECVCVCRMSCVCVCVCVSVNAPPLVVVYALCVCVR